MDSKCCLRAGHAAYSDPSVASDAAHSTLVNGGTSYVGELVSGFAKSRTVAKLWACLSRGVSGLSP